jgi:hypothetical protein
LSILSSVIQLDRIVGVQDGSTALDRVPAAPPIGRAEITKVLREVLKFSPGDTLYLRLAL